MVVPPFSTGLELSRAVGPEQNSVDADHFGGVQRRLAALCFADIAGWTAMVEQRDSVALQTWLFLRERILFPLAEQFHGKLLDMAGDSVLIEFSSVTNAIAWAQAVQSNIEASAPKIGSTAVKLRIAVSVDDCVIDAQRLVGDGINIASRLQQLAQPGEILTTEVVRLLATNKTSAIFVDRGEHQLKNLSRSLRVYSVQPSQEFSVEAPRSPYNQWHTRATIAVLPFRTIGAGDAPTYFAEGITEEIINGIARTKLLFVIARSSTLRYAKHRPDGATIARELGVRYLLDGSVQQAANKLRISVELTDAVNGQSLWSHRFEGCPEDIFVVQDQIVAQVVPAIEPQVMSNEIRRTQNHPTASLSAYDWLLRARSKMFTFDPEDFALCGDYLQRANALDPNYAQVKANLAWWYSLRLGEGWSTDRDADKTLCLRYAQEGAYGDREDTYCTAVWGHILAFTAQMQEEAEQQFNLAIDNDPNSAFSWGTSASNLCFMGRPQEAVERLKNAYRLSPFDRMNFMFWTIQAIAEFMQENYTESIVWSRKALRENGRFIAAQRTLTAALAMADEQIGAQKAATRLLELAPKFTVKDFISWYPLRLPKHLTQLEVALLKAGIRE
jgi:adenylate cyclase